MKIKNGDTVFFNMSNDELPVFRVGKIICKTMDDKSYNVLSFWNHGISVYQTSNIYPVKDKHIVLDMINNCYDKKINILQSQLKSVKRDDYKHSLANKYLLLKTEILNTFKNLVNAETSGDLEITKFENSLKAIANKKKQIFEIECDEVVEARKINGKIKYEINTLQKQKDDNFGNIDLSIINKYIK